jgi:hypothetical protein
VNRGLNSCESMGDASSIQARSRTAAACSEELLPVIHRPRFTIGAMSVPENNLRVDYVEFPVTDIGRTKEFYSKVFGWRFAGTTLNGLLTGAAGRINGTTRTDHNVDRVGVGTGVYSLGAPRQVAFGLVIRF